MKRSLNDHDDTKATRQYAGEEIFVFIVSSWFDA